MAGPISAAEHLDNTAPQERRSGGELLAKLRPPSGIKERIEISLIYPKQRVRRVEYNKKKNITLKIKI